MKDFKESFLYKAHCENGIPSSKRFWGGVGYCIVQVCLVVTATLSLIKTGGLDSMVSNLIEFDLITSASLLGLSTITRVFGGTKTSVGNSSVNSTDQNSPYIQDTNNNHCCNCERDREYYGGRYHNRYKQNQQYHHNDDSINGNEYLGD